MGIYLKHMYINLSQEIIEQPNSLELLYSNLFFFFFSTAMGSLFFVIQ